MIFISLLQSKTRTRISFPIPTEEVVRFLVLGRDNSLDDSSSFAGHIKTVTDIKCFAIPYSRAQEEPGFRLQPTDTNTRTGWLSGTDSCVRDNSVPGVRLIICLSRAPHN